MGKVGSKPAHTLVPDAAIYAALESIAGVIEEPYCKVGAVELRGLVTAHVRLSVAIGIEPDYRWLNGKAVARENGDAAIKEPVPGWPGNIWLKPEPVADAGHGR